MAGTACRSRGLATAPLHMVHYLYKRERMLPLILLLIGTLVAWGSWGFVLFYFDALTDGWVPHMLFYGSLALSFIGTLMLLGLQLHKWRTGMMASRFKAGMIARQASLITLFTVVVLNLAAGRLLKWWNIIPLALLVLALELFFSSLHKHANPTSQV